MFQLAQDWNGGSMRLPEVTPMLSWHAGIDRMARVVGVLRQQGAYRIRPTQMKKKTGKNYWKSRHESDVLPSVDEPSNARPIDRFPQLAGWLAGSAGSASSPQRSFLPTLAGGLRRTPRKTKSEKCKNVGWWAGGRAKSEGEVEVSWVFLPHPCLCWPS
jgi:hypothetical protein